MRTFFLFSILFLFSTCSSKKNLTKVASHKTNLHITLTAKDLSEDFSKLSTKNDEIVFLAYTVGHDDSTKISPIVCAYCVFDSLKMEYNFISDSITSPFKDNLVFALIEMDDEQNKEQIESTMNSNFTKISRAFQENDLVTLANYLGDNDVLGIAFVENGKIKTENENSIVISGIHLFDSYKYILTFKE